MSESEQQPTALTLVLSSARSGSTLLCRDIASLGGLGAPREYMKGLDAEARARRRSELLSEAEVIARVARGIREDAPGVGALKLMLPQASTTYEAISGRRLPPDKAMARVVEWARKRFDRVLLVFLFRNTIDQTISRIVAHETGIFHSSDQAFRDSDDGLRFEIEDMNARILAELGAVLRNRTMLHSILAKHSDIALALTYDELTRDVDLCTARLVAHAREHGFEPRAETVTRTLTKLISPERSASLRASFIDYLATETGAPA